ncbi:B- and T-lymphocyte attenuator-like [Protopterus annectens]|uniref:B- and T-lymphocyte attenuator-like n=1 Tax=Protopterus annectens TaxID=7888 RepID=UPI001CFAAB0A|nr:B- and T-lymphocyte attenuator-like [Protopterus annectens]
MLLQKIWSFVTFSLMMLNLQTQGIEEPCLLAISVHRHTKFHTFEGKSSTLNCPVNYCINKGTPIVSWCKQEGKTCSSLENKAEANITWTPYNETFGNASFTIPSVNISDNGSYACKAQQAGQTAKSHYIQLLVSEKQGTHTTTSQSALSGGTTDSSDGNFWIENTWLLYVFIGLIVVVTAICFILCCSVKTWKAKKMSQDVQPKETKKVRTFKKVRIVIS